MVPTYLLFNIEKSPQQILRNRYNEKKMKCQLQLF